MRMGILNLARRVLRPIFPFRYFKLPQTYLHNWNNNPINTNDINSGFNAIAAGGTLSIIDYNPPAIGGGHGFH
jgi:hypothetical protein